MGHPSHPERFADQLPTQTDAARLSSRDISRPFGWLTPGHRMSYDTIYLEAKEFHAQRVRTLVIACLAGGIPFAPGWFQKPGCAPSIERLDCGDLLDVMGITDTPELIAKLFSAAFDRDTKGHVFGEAEDILAAYVDKTAAILASEEASQA